MDSKDSGMKRLKCTVKNRFFTYMYISVQNMCVPAFS